MATPSSRSKGSLRSDAMRPTSQRSRLRSQQRFSSSSMTPVPWAACCKQRRYGDRSPASYTSIRSTTFAESLSALLTRNALEAISQLSRHIHADYCGWHSGLLPVTACMSHVCGKTGARQIIEGSTEYGAYSWAICGWTWNNGLSLTGPEQKGTSIRLREQIAKIFALF